MRLIHVLIFPTLACAVLAQSGHSITITEQDAASHLISHAEPNYPPIAKAVQVSGQVQLELTVNPQGHVVAAKAINGHPMLKGAAEDCVKQWVYQPFLKNGQAMTTIVLATVNFALPAPINPDDQKIAQKFFPQQNACLKATRDRSGDAKAAETCTSAAKTAETFSTQERFIERRSAYVYAAGALLRNKQFPEALDYANKADEVIQQGHDDGAGISAVYFTRAEVEAAMGNLDAADLDLTRSEKAERDAIAKIHDKEMEQHYAMVLQRILQFHARVLEADGKPEAAKAKSVEAATL